MVLNPSPYYYVSVESQQFARILLVDFFVARPSPELIQTQTNPPFKIGNHRPHMVGDDFQFRILVENSRQRKTSHSHGT